jgi:hypothetical protein
MLAITYFTDLLVSPLKTTIDLTKIPIDIRAWLCRSLDKFGDGIKILILGMGSGGVVPEAFSETVMKGQPNITYFFLLNTLFINYGIRYFYYFLIFFLFHLF